MALVSLFVGEIILLGVLLAASAFFSLSETAMIAVNRLKVRHQAEAGDHRAKRVDRMLDEPERIIGTVLVGNNIVNIGAASLGVVIALQLWPENGVLISSIAVTTVVLVFCELMPKTLAVQHPLLLSKAVARPLRLVEQLLKPVIFLAGGASKVLLRMFGEKARGRAPYITSDEIEVLVRMGVEHGDVEQFEQRVIKELFRFTETDVRKVLTPAPLVHYVQRTATLQEAADVLTTSRRSRVLVVDGDLGRVIGCVHARQLLRYTDEQLRALPVSHALRPVLFAPADLPADRLLVRMQKDHKLLAVIQDPQDGRTLGVCTVEDLLEELVGEIHDEFDHLPAATGAGPGAGAA
ncbi:MAG: HlyC/CorC family transporter [Euryarchaeota archaeon]|nr:HlyC/CorC family transporter [Euryarchaeota archaeon]